MSGEQGRWTTLLLPKPRAALEQQETGELVHCLAEAEIHG